jgi:sugar lactone lactonase YvrE
MKSTSIALVVAALVASGAQAATPPAEIVIPGERLFTESLTSTADGSVIIGSVGGRTIFRAKPGESQAQAWIQPGTDGLAGVFGVLADDKSTTLYACSGSFGPPGAAGAPPPPPSALHAFDLETGAPKGKWNVPTAGGFCNDIAVDANGTAYITDTSNMEVAALKPGAKALEVWAGSDGSFGPKGGVLDGIAVVQDKVVVNALRTGKLFSVPIGKDGKAGTVAEVKLDRPLDGPDGQRTWGKDSILVAEGSGVGKLSRVTLSGANLDVGKVTTLKEGFPDTAVAVTVIGETAYVLEGQLAALRGPPNPDAKPKPFKATAVNVGKP